MMEREVWVGVGRAEGEGRVWKVFERTVTVGLRGFKGVTGSEWRRYQVKTGNESVSMVHRVTES